MSNIIKKIILYTLLALIASVYAVTNPLIVLFLIFIGVRLVGLIYLYSPLVALLCHAAYITYYSNRTTILYTVSDVALFVVSSGLTLGSIFAMDALIPEQHEAVTTDSNSELPQPAPTITIEVIEQEPLVLHNSPSIPFSPRVENVPEPASPTSFPRALVNSPTSMLVPITLDEYLLDVDVFQQDLLVNFEPERDMASLPKGPSGPIGPIRAYGLWTNYFLAGGSGKYVDIGIGDGLRVPMEHVASSQLFPRIIYTVNEFISNLTPSSSEYLNRWLVLTQVDYPAPIYYFNCFECEGLEYKVEPREHGIVPPYFIWEHLELPQNSLAFQHYTAVKTYFLTRYGGMDGIKLFMAYRPHLNVTLTAICLAEGLIQQDQEKALTLEPMKLAFNPDETLVFMFQWCERYSLDVLLKKSPASGLSKDIWEIPLIPKPEYYSDEERFDNTSVKKTIRKITEDLDLQKLKINLNKKESSALCDYAVECFKWFVGR